MDLTLGGKADSSQVPDHDSEALHPVSVQMVSEISTSASSSSMYEGMLKVLKKLSNEAGLEIGVFVKS